VSELQQILEQIRKKYEVEEVPLKFGGKQLKILQFKDFEAYLENLIDNTPAVSLKDLPVWAKLWEASFLLGYFLGKQPVVPWQRMLEIGAVGGVMASVLALRKRALDSAPDRSCPEKLSVRQTVAKAPCPAPAAETAAPLPPPISHQRLMVMPTR